MSALQTDGRQKAAGERLPAPPGFGYRPGLDGLRAVAVIAVLLYHGGVWWTPGGFFGVDVFFVLSGYLITTLLILEHRRTGRIDLPEFYRRRARRLLPALFLVLLFVALYAAWFSPPGQLADLRGDALATLAYVANWRFVFNQASYFDQFQDPSPLRHMWSLGIEEQWYLLSPLLLALGLTWIGTKRLFWPVITIALAAGSALLMFVLFDPTVDPSRVYYGTDTRVQALLIGAALAFLLTGRELTGPLRRVISGLGLVGLLLVMGAIRFVQDSDPGLYRGGFTLVALLSAATVAAAATPDTLVARLLSVRPLVAIGTISYGLYLWHWPVYVLLSPERTGIDGDALLALRLAVTAAASVASYSVVERPVRTGALRDRRRPAAIVVFGAVVLASVLVVGPSNESGDALASDASEVDGPVSDSDVRTLVVGDSVALSLAVNHDRALTENKIGVRSAAILGCGVAIGEIQRIEGPSLNRDCSFWPDTWRRRVDEFDPDVSIVLVGAWEVFDRVVEAELLEVGTDAYAAHLEEQLDQGVDILTSRGGQVLLSTVPCMQPKERVGTVSLVERSDAGRSAWVSEVMRDYASSRDDVTLADLRNLQCPEGEYEEAIDDTVLHTDGVHYTRDGAGRAWSYLAPLVIEGGRAKSG